MSVTVSDIEQILRSIAPFETAEEYDNVGLLVGSGKARVTGITVMLDATAAGIAEAAENGSSLIVTHHPLMFHARKRIVTDDDEEARLLYELIRRDMALISVHTNLDKSFCSGSAACARLLGLTGLRQEDFLFLGDLPEAMPAGKLRAEIERALGFPTRVYTGPDKTIRTLAIVGGAGDSEWKKAKAMGADALLTGEVHHHIALEAAAEGFLVFDGGHYGTEAPLVPELADLLRGTLAAQGQNVPVFASAVRPFA